MVMIENIIEVIKIILLILGILIMLIIWLYIEAMIRIEEMRGKKDNDGTGSNL